MPNETYRKTISRLKAETGVHRTALAMIIVGGRGGNHRVRRSSQAETPGANTISLFLEQMPSKKEVRSL